MPAATHYTPQDAKLREAAQTERAKRQTWNNTAWNYYRGDHPKPLKVKPGRPDQNVIINLVQQHADHTISFAVPEFPALELHPDVETAHEEALRTWWDAQGGAVWLANTMLSGFLAGHVFTRLLPPTQPGGRARLITLNPANVLAMWAEDDYETALWFEVYYRAGAKLRRQDLIAPGVLEPGDIDLGDGAMVRITGEQWVIREWEQIVRLREGEADRPSNWKPIGLTEWSYDCKPIVDWQHLPQPGGYYGPHELHSLALNNAVNAVASDIKSILRVHASPRRVAIGVPPDAIKNTAIDSFWAIDGKTPQEVAIENLEMESDLQSSMAFIQYLTAAYMQQARVTLLEGGPDAYKNVTNLGIKAAFMSQIGKTETLHAQYGGGIAEISVGAMAIEGRQIAPPVPRWKAALPESEKEKTETQVMQLNAGVQSRQGAAARLGNDYATISRQRLLETVVDGISDGTLPGGVD